jgi:hypothetical protein
MSDFNIVITRCTFTAGLDGNSPRKIIGFTVQNPDASKQIYHEAVLQQDQFVGKNDEDCVEIAFGILSSSIAISANEVKTGPTVIGSLYIPS